MKAHFTKYNKCVIISAFFYFAFSINVYNKDTIYGRTKLKMGMYMYVAKNFAAKLKCSYSNKKMSKVSC